MGIIVREACLFYTSGRSDKEYRVVIEQDPAAGGYIVYGLNGRRGSATARQPKTAAAVSLASADAIFESVFTEKARKGYTTEPSGTPHAPAVLPPRRAPAEAPRAEDRTQFEQAELPGDEARLESLLCQPEVVLQWAAHANPYEAMLTVDTLQKAELTALPGAVRTELAALRTARVLGILSEDRLVVFDALVTPARGHLLPVLSARLRQAQARLRTAGATHVTLAPWACADEAAQLYALFDVPSGPQAWIVRPDAAVSAAITVFSVNRA